MHSKKTADPLYRLIDESSEAVILTADDIRGFFATSEPESEGKITFTGIHNIDPSRRRIEDAELEVVNYLQERIGAYHAGRILLTASTVAGTPGNDETGIEYSFFGYTCEYEHAGTIWRRWAEERPIKLGEWADCPAEQHSSWLHVVQEAWFSAGRRAMKYGAADSVSIDGRKTSTRAGFYCALGEAVNGPGGTSAQISMPSPTASRPVADQCPVFSSHWTIRLALAIFWVMISLPAQLAYYANSMSR